jgi:hypothetical protein
LPIYIHAPSFSPSFLIVSSRFFLGIYPNLGGATSRLLASPFGIVFTFCIVVSWGLSGGGAG